jgi:TolB-like protein/Tfp pilus assembly protein PilF
MAIWSAEIKELERLYESLKGQLPDLEKELERLFRADDENMILLYSRRCLEVIITDLCECELKRPRKTEPLKGIIDKLHKEEKVPSHIITSMHGLNDLSTYGAHPKDFDPKQIRTTLINLETIIEWYFKYKGIDIKGEEEIQFKGESLEEVKKEARIEEQEKPTKLPKQKLLSGVIITAIVIIAAILAYPKIFKRDTLEDLRTKGKISVAVMPFQNMTNDTIWNIWQDGIQNELITYLTNSKQLNVRQIESLFSLIQGRGLTNYASITPTVARNIAHKLDANVFIYGTIKQAGSRIRLNTQLIDSKTEEIIKSFEIDGPAKEEMIFQIVDSLRRMVKNFLIITEIGKELSLDYHGEISTNSPEAYRYFIYGQKAFLKRDNSTAMKMYSQALAIDSNHVWAAIMLPFTYRNQGLYDQAKKWCLKVYKKKNQMTIQQKIFTNYLYAIFFETIYEAIKYDMQLLELDDQWPINYYGLCVNYNRLYQYDKAIIEGEKALDIYEKWDSKPESVWPYTGLGLAYHKTGQYKKEKKLYEKAERDFPDNPDLIYRQAVLSLTKENIKDAREYIEKYISILKENSVTEASIAIGQAGIYSEADLLDIAEEYYRKALSLEPKSQGRMNTLAYFLIDKDRNVSEGLGLIEKIVESNPDNYNYLHIKGWGFYKQGKYNEALEILQKSWDLRRQNAIYNHEAFLHLEEAKKAVASQKNN